MARKQAKAEKLTKRELQSLEKLLQQELLNARYNDRVMSEEFAISPDDLADEADLASSDIDQNMRMRLGNRETLYLKKVLKALERIKNEEYGECKECGEQIGFKRLLARATAELCIVCKEEQEKNEKLSVRGSQHKSLGRSLGNRLNLR